MFNSASFMTASMLSLLNATSLSFDRYLFSFDFQF